MSATRLAGGGGAAPGIAGTWTAGGEGTTGAVAGPGATIVAAGDWSMNNCSWVPPRLIVTLSKSTEVRVTPGTISSPTAKLRWTPSGVAMIAEPRPDAWSWRI